ncbi:major facilitator superfamily domain-containing protein [Infundibulicybe gibba]|nr:major facilitator superfamily domain-containing protein [Infundibulicybe gibba]
MSEPRHMPTETRSPMVLKKRSQSTDIYTFHERRVGRLVLDPKEAVVEFGELFTSRLKLTKDGTKILWPQPTDDPEDPQNWSDRRKGVQLLIITLAAIVPDFDSGIGIASVFLLAKEFHTTTGVINNLTSNWSIFLIGWGGLFFVMLMRRYGRLPILFWTQLLALGFLVGTTFAPTLKIFAAMRCLTGFFGTCPQITINIWTMGVILAPHLSPFLFGFLVSRTTWRWAYGVGCLYGAAVLLLMYDTGRPSWTEVALAPLHVVWRPHFLGIIIFEVGSFDLTNKFMTVCKFRPWSLGLALPSSIGIRTERAHSLWHLYDASCETIYPFVGYMNNVSEKVAVVLGELVGRYLNDWVMNMSIRRNQGVFEAEARLWTCYVGVLLFVIGFVILGAALQNHLNIGVVIIGWGIAQISVVVNTVAVYAYCNDCFPRQQGEVSALLNLSRVLGGFGVAFYQVPWAMKHGALQTLGLEATIVAGLFVIVVPLLQYKGRMLRQRFSTSTQK